MAAYESRQDELAQFQELSNKWEPEATGPLVSERLSSSNITAEYANADPIFQAKTAALPQKYVQMRTCRGDGLCGWRATIFGYFESLLRVGDKNKFAEEETRLKSLHNILNQVGFQEYLYEQFADDTFQLLQETAASIGLPDDGAPLLAAFNDDNRSKSIITYFKCLTSAWLQTHPDQFQSFVDQPLQAYCAARIEPTMCEIEHVGMSALVDMLVKPAGTMVEILYLDRSPGTVANTFRWEPVDQNGIPLPSPPAIRLLYRPGHYDILYKAEDIPAPKDLVVALQHASTEHYHSSAPFSFGSYEIPGMSVFNGPNVTWSPSAPYEFVSADVTTSMAHQVPRSAPTPTYAPTPMISPPEYFSRPLSVESPTSPMSMTFQSSLRHPMTADNGGPFRHSIWEYEHNLTPAPAFSSSCQTSIFKNSHYNTAHFNNPDFEPEQWQPGADYLPSERSRKKSRAEL